MNRNDLGLEIGRGGHGAVFTLKSNPDQVVKISSRNNDCRKWSDEFQKIQALHEALKDHPLFQKLESVKLIRVDEFLEDKKTGDCFMTMQRVYRPWNPVDKRDSQPTIHAFFNESSETKITPQRGELWGIEQMKASLALNDTSTIYPELMLKQMSYELGILIGLIHFVARNDAYDVEVYWGRQHEKKQLQLFMADFDLSETMSSDNMNVTRMAQSLGLVPYFPHVEVQPMFFETFALGYRQAAATADSIALADQVLQEFESDY